MFLDGAVRGARPLPRQTFGIKSPFWRSWVAYWFTSFGTPVGASIIHILCNSWPRVISGQVPRPGHVTPPPKSSRSYHSHSFWPIGFVLTGFHNSIGTYNSVTSDLWYQWPKVSYNYWPPHYIIISGNIEVLPFLRIRMISSQFLWDHVIIGHSWRPRCHICSVVPTGSAEVMRGHQHYLSITPDKIKIEKWNWQ